MFSPMHWMIFEKLVRCETLESLFHGIEQLGCQFANEGQVGRLEEEALIYQIKKQWLELGVIRTWLHC